MIKVLTMNGVTVNTFNISQGDPSYLAVNSSGDKILVSIYDYGVLCIDNTGNTLYTYSDSQLKLSSGLLFDSYDNFMVCRSTNNIQVVKSDGTDHRIIFTGDDGVNNLKCLAYRSSDNNRVIGQSHGSDSLLSFTITCK